MTETNRDMRECLTESIRSFNEANGYSPSFRELAESCGTSVAVVHYWLSKLSSEGRVRYLPGQPRTLVLLAEVSDA